MVYTPELDSVNPWSYACVIRIFHAHVCTTNDKRFQRMEFLWVRWFKMDQLWEGGPETRHLERVEFVTEEDDEEMFGFVDPEQVIRGCHIIPAFSLERDISRLGPSMAREPDGDWHRFYVNWLCGLHISVRT